MKPIRLFLAACLLLLSAACVAPSPAVPAATPTQQALYATTTSYQALSAAIEAADVAVKSGVLKGQDARNTLKGLTDAKTGLDVALVALRTANVAAVPPTPASGVLP